MAEPDNVKLVSELYAAFGLGDLPAILAKLADDVDWQHPRPADIPWGGIRRGREAATGFFAALAQHVDVLAFEPQHFVAQGEKVLVTGHERMRAKATGKTYAVDWVQAWTIRKGKVAAFREYTDTASIAEALRPG
jgi:uncharacterized protein